MNKPDRATGHTGASGVGGGKVVLVLVVACGLFAAAIYGIIKAARPRLAPAVPIVSAGSPVVTESAPPSSSSPPPVSNPEPSSSAKAPPLPTAEH